MSIWTDITGLGLCHIAATMKRGIAEPSIMDERCLLNFQDTFLFMGVSFRIHPMIHDGSTSHLGTQVPTLAPEITPMWAGSYSVWEYLDQEYAQGTMTMTRAPHQTGAKER